jgi:hypothetical protein
MRRGLKIDALKNFIFSQGGSRSVAFIEVIFNKLKNKA